MNTRFLPPGRSDELPQLLRTIRAHPALHHLVEIPPRLRLIVDSNVILNDLRWCCRKRANPNARTSLLEAAHSGIVTLYAPSDVRFEVLDHFEEFQREFDIRPEDIRAAWTPYETMIKWVDPRITKRGQRDVSKRTKRDPTDAPCVALSIQLGVGVLSGDLDYTSFGITFYKPVVTEALRSHARAMVKEIHLSLGAAGTLAISGGLVYSAARSFRKLPPKVQILCGFALLGLIAHDGGRRWVRRIVEPLKDVGAEAFDEFAASLRDAQAERTNHVVAHLQPSRPQTLADYIAVSLAESSQLLTAKEIGARVLEEGYETKSRALPRVVGTTLRRDSRFQQTAGRWELRPLAPTEPTLY